MNKNFVLVFNCGSSSVKFTVIDPISEHKEVSGIVERIGTQDTTIKWEHNGSKQSKNLDGTDYQSAINFIVSTIQNIDHLDSKIIAVGHRVVHGGESFTQSVVIDENVLNKIKSCIQLAPLHNPANVTGIIFAKKAYPNVPHVAVFDTAFHQTMPNYAYTYAIPYELYKKHGVRRYGFHGTSHRFVTQKASEIIEKKFDASSFISAHLGNGCSITAVLNGKSIDTSMGLTPLEGLMMGTRSGDVDPSLHEYLAETLGYDIRKITNLLNKQSGLLGISEVNSDMREVSEAAKKGNEQAILAIEIFCYRLAKYIGAYSIPLGKIDALIFTGGIGENDADVREKVINWLKVLNFKLDKSKNANHGKNSNGVITQEQSNIAIVIPTNEELLIAKDAVALVKK